MKTKTNESNRNLIQDIASFFCCSSVRFDVMSFVSRDIEMNEHI